MTVIIPSDEITRNPKDSWLLAIDDLSKEVLYSLEFLTQLLQKEGCFDLLENWLS